MTRVLLCGLLLVGSATMARAGELDREMAPPTPSPLTAQPPALAAGSGTEMDSESPLAAWHRRGWGGWGWGGPRVSAFSVGFSTVRPWGWGGGWGPGWGWGGWPGYSSFSIGYSSFRPWGWGGGWGWGGWCW
jgi:hypothetical protein